MWSLAIDFSCDDVSHGTVGIVHFYSNISPNGLLLALSGRSFLNVVIYVGVSGGFDGVGRVSSSPSDISHPIDWLSCSFFRATPFYGSGVVPWSLPASLRPVHGKEKCLVWVAFLCGWRLSFSHGTLRSFRTSGRSGQKCKRVLNCIIFSLGVNHAVRGSVRIQNVFLYGLQRKWLRPWIRSGQ